MSDTLLSLRRKLGRAKELKSVVRTMKSLAMASIGQYEQSIRALADYYHAVELGLCVCFRESEPAVLAPKKKGPPDMGVIGAVIFGSDQGLVGQFNDVVADYALKMLPAQPDKIKIWAVGERVYMRLEEAKLPIMGLFAVPTSVKAITPLVGQILIDTETAQSRGEISKLFIFHNRPKVGETYEPVNQQLLPLDENWRRNLVNISWPTRNLPEVLGSVTGTLPLFISGYLFVSLFRACAESLASENVSRLAAMQRAEKNINDMLDELKSKYYRLRQSVIDEELFDVISGFEALSGKK